MFPSWYYPTVIFCGVAGILFTLWLSLLPCTIAVYRGSPRATAIALLGFFGFWITFGIAWFGAVIWAFCEPIKPTKRSWVGWAWRFLPVCMIPLWVVAVVVVFNTAFKVNESNRIERQAAFQRQQQEDNERMQRERIAREQQQQAIAAEEREKNKPFVPNVEQQKKDLAEMLAKDREAGMKARQEQQKREAEQLKEQKKEQEQKNWRDWTINGKVVKAKFVKYIAGVTFLELEGGEQLRVDVSSLGSADKNWIESKWKK